MKAKSETTHGFGRYHVNSLVRIRARDERGPPMNTTERIPVWSSVRGKYTPWITYREVPQNISLLVLPYMYTFTLHIDKGTNKQFENTFLNYQ